MWRLAREVLFECAQLALDPFMKRRPEITAARTMLETMRCHLDEGASAEELWKARDVVLKEMESVQTDSEDEAAYVEAGARICEIIREKIPLREVLVALATGAK